MKIKLPQRIRFSSQKEQISSGVFDLCLIELLLLLTTHTHLVSQKKSQVSTTTHLRYIYMSMRL